MSFIQHSGQNVVPLWINGAAPALQPERFLPITNARDNKVVHQAQGASKEDACAAADAAAHAFESWKNTLAAHRRSVLLKAADILEAEAENVAQAQALETSCTIEYARFMPKLAVGVIREIASAITAALTGTMPPMDGEGYGFIFKEAIGPVLCIVPWNSPPVLGMRGMSSALAAGCTVVLKASEVCPYTFRLLVDVFERAGLPKGCINQVQAGRENAASVTEALIAHPAIRKIEFIGSAAVGRSIGQTAAQYLKPVLMELGGKGPALVLADANLPAAAKACAWGAFLHHGQICFSTERIIAVSSVADEFARLLKAEVETNYSKEVGCAALPSSAVSAHGKLESAKENGAEFLVGDNSFLNSTSTSLKPTIVTGVKRSDAMFDEETFGPSASLYTASSTDEAVRMANDSAYGLNAAIWTEDMGAALGLARQLDYGQVHVNSTTVNDPATLPVSGVKGSGWGDNNSVFGISEFLVNKTVTLHRSDEEPSFGKHE